MLLPEPLVVMKAFASPAIVIVIVFANVLAALAVPKRLPVTVPTKLLATILPCAVLSTNVFGIA